MGGGQIFAFSFLVLFTGGLIKAKIAKLWVLNIIGITRIMRTARATTVKWFGQVNCGENLRTDLVV